MISRPPLTAPPPLALAPPSCSSRAAQLQQPSRRTADQQCSRAALAPEPPGSRAAPPEPPYRRAAWEPSRPGAELLSSRAAFPTEPPDLPCPVSTVPLSLRALPYCLHCFTVVVMATPSVLAFDAEGRAIDFEVWLDDLQLFLQCDRADGLSLFDLTSGAVPSPAADADAIVRSQWATRDAAARLAVRRHLPTAERAHFSQYKSAQTLYDAVVARYSSPATAALSRLMLPFLFPDLAAFPTVADLGCSPSPLLPSVASAAAADLVGLESVGAASAPSGRRRSGKGKGGKGAGGAMEAGVAAAVAVVAEVAEVAAVEAEAGAVEAEAGVAEVEVVGVELRSGAALEERQRGGGFGPCTYVLRTGNRTGEQCGGTHTAQRYFGRLTDAWRQQFPEAAEIPRWGELSRAGVAIFDLDFDAILAAMYAVTISDEGDCYRCFPPDPGIGTAAPGAGEAGRRLQGVAVAP
ncbi:unnamed protein product [Closterium sp. NIES-64]|nr:unnamed protein product [Closterium sp. NIES-64]